MYLNRELSWLEFNQRVLNEARRADLPLLERLKFLAISAGNLDEFFQVRVGGLMLVARSGKGKADLTGLMPGEQLELIRKRAQEMVHSQYELFENELLPLMRDAGVAPVAMSELNDAQRSTLESYFLSEVAPLLTPLAPEVDKPPILPNLNLILGVELATPGEPGSRIVAVTLPDCLPRRIHAACLGQDAYVLSEDLTAHFITHFFENERILNCVPLRVTRNGDIAVQEEEGGDFAWEMSQVLVARKFSDCVRLEIPRSAPGAFVARMAALLKADSQCVYRVPGYLRMVDFVRMAQEPGHDTLKVLPWSPYFPAGVDADISMFENIARGDILINTPFESYEPVVKLAEEAASDPNVLAIKQVLYRTAMHSRFVAALIRAAELGKQVTVLVELKARFDEGHNLAQAEQLQRAGVQVVYGVRGYKTHAKVMLIVRRENGTLRRYCHIGTGNYNEDTAKLYGDLSLLTADDDIGADASQFFNSVTGLTAIRRFRKLQPSPALMKEHLLALIDAETRRAVRGERAAIHAKMNSLNDREMMDALEKAADAGVTICLNVRGICCWYPSTDEGRRRTRIVSIVDRYLEHARIFCFHNGGNNLVFIASADWMSRNLDRRVELLVPITDKKSAKRARDILDACFRDNCRSSVMQADGTYLPAAPSAGQRPFRMQEHLQRQARRHARTRERNSRTILEPHRPKSHECPNVLPPSLR